MAKFRHAIVGGTFDRFHAGHRHFLGEAIKSSEFLTIGITTPALFGHKPLSSRIEPFDIRKIRVEKYLEDNGFGGKFQIIPLENIYGNALIEKNIDAIFTTHHSIKNVDKINYEREMHGFPALDVVFIEPLTDSTGKTISSSRIRSGEIDNEGIRVFKGKNTGN